MSAAELVSPYVGLVRSTVDFMHAADESRLPTVGCAMADGEPLEVGLATSPSGSGRTRAAAIAAAVGEAAERYAAALAPPLLPLASAADLGDEAVEPASFALFHERQYATPGFPFRRFTDSTAVRWTRARCLATGRPRLVPAQLVYLRRPPADEPPIAYATSNGIACGPTHALALRSGLCEAIERDAFMIAWYGRLSLPLLDWRGHPAIAAADRRYFARTGLEYFAVHLGVFLGVPAVLGVVFGGAGEPGALGIGAACAPTIEEAWLKALGEAFAVKRWARDVAYETAGERPPEARELVTFADHTRYWSAPGRSVRARFLTASADRVSTRDVPPLEGSAPEAQVEALCERLDGAGASAYAVELTTVDVASAGLRVVRAVVPELAPLDVIEQARYAGGTRLYRAAHHAGLVPRPLTYDELNPDPHPFP